MATLALDHARSDFDPFGWTTRVDPYPAYTALRGAGPAVRLDKYGIWAVPRYAEIKTIFADHVNFSNAGGAGIANYFKTKPWRPPSIILEADPPLHTKTRKVLARIMSPGAMRRLENDFKAKAVELVDGLVARGSFDAIRDVAEVFPLSVFPDALGIDSEGRENFLTYGAMVFAGMGPENDYFRNLMMHAPTVLPWVTAKCRREALAPGSFGAQVYEAADSGEITEEEAPLLVRSFLSAGLDTTISAIGMALYSLARHPEQWAILAANPSLSRAAFDETLRFELGGALCLPDHPARNRDRRRADRRAREGHPAARFRQPRRKPLGAAGPIRHHPPRRRPYRIRYRHPRLRRPDGGAARRRGRAVSAGQSRGVNRDRG